MDGANIVKLGSAVIVDMTDATAQAEDIAEGETAYGADGSKITGTKKDISALTVAELMAL